MSRDKRKIRVAVLYGGRSGEHEVSLLSAASVLRYLDPSRYEAVPIGIGKDGRWHFNDLSLIEQGAKSLPIFKDSPEVLLPPYPAPASGENTLVPVGKSSSGLLPSAIDVVFPAMHGPLCEDGSVQGLFELADVAYVGSGVLASAVGMDKDVAKRLVAGAGIAVTPYFSLSLGKFRADKTAAVKQVEKLGGYPVFVKPANQGSSVGIHKAKDPASLLSAIEDAFRYDVKILIEKGIDAREIELSVLENPAFGEPALVSEVGEITPTHEFYSYEAKYLDENGAALLIPAKLSATEKEEAKTLSRRIFEALECEGMARVDLFLDRKTGKFLFNEVNTLPGFTSISMYPKLWEASGVSYSDLLSKLIELAIARHGRRKSLLRERK